MPINNPTVPDGAQIKDGATPPKAFFNAATRKIYGTNGTTVLADFSQAGHVFLMDGAISFDTGGELHGYTGVGTWDLDGFTLFMGGGTITSTTFKYTGNNTVIGSYNADGDQFRWQSEDGNTFFDNRGFFHGLTTPASAGAVGKVGNIVWDANFIYVCVATNTWKRAAISTW